MQMRHHHGWMTHQTTPKVSKRPDGGERIIGCSERNTEDNEQKIGHLKVLGFNHRHHHDHLHDHHRKVEDEDVGGAPHGLVKDDDEGDEEVPNEADDDHQGEDDRHLKRPHGLDNVDKSCMVM